MNLHETLLQRLYSNILKPSGFSAHHFVSPVFPANLQGIRNSRTCHQILEADDTQNIPKNLVTLLHVIGRKSCFQSSPFSMGKNLAWDSWFQRVGLPITSLSGWYNEVCILVFEACIVWAAKVPCEDSACATRQVVNWGTLALCNASWGMVGSKKSSGQWQALLKDFLAYCLHVQNPGFNAVSCLMSKNHLKLSNHCALWFDAWNMPVRVSWSFFFQISSLPKCSHLIQQLRKQSRKGGTSQNHLWTFIPFSASSIETVQLFQVNSIQTSQVIQGFGNGEQMFSCCMVSVGPKMVRVQMVQIHAQRNFETDLPRIPHIPEPPPTHVPALPQHSPKSWARFSVRGFCWVNLSICRILYMYIIYIYISIYNIYIYIHMCLSIATYLIIEIQNLPGYYCDLVYLDIGMSAYLCVAIYHMLDSCFET